MPDYEKTITLPSRGIFYRDQLPGGELQIRSMTTQEEKLLTSTSQSGIIAINSLMRRCTNLPEDFPPEKLLTSDRFSLLVQIRIVSYGSSYRIPFNCKVCGKLSWDNIDLEKDVLSTELQLPGDVQEQIDVELPLSGKIITWRYPTGEDETAADKQRGRLRSIGDMHEFRIARQIVAVDGQAMQHIDVLTLLRKLKTRDSVAIRDSMNEHAFGAEAVELYFTCTNPECRAEQPPSKLPVTEDFFRVVSPSGGF